MRFQDVDVNYVFRADNINRNHDPNLLLGAMNAVGALDVLVSCDYMDYAPEWRHLRERGQVQITLSGNTKRTDSQSDIKERCVLVNLVKPGSENKSRCYITVSGVENLRGYEVSFIDNGGMRIVKRGRNPIRYEFY